MSEISKIGWTDSTWNPVRGCSKVSPGCKNCYAATFSERFRGVEGHPFEQGFDLRLVPEKLDVPLKWREPRRIFVNSMSDLFHEDVPTDYIRKVCDVMMQATQHEYQILTKRADRMWEVLSSPEFRDVARAKHIWWGVSVENKKYGYPRVQALRETPVRNRFISCEPLLEDVSDLDLTDIHWVIIGGESGPHYREFQIDWARDLRDRCFATKVPVFVKQLGGGATLPGGSLLPIRHKGEDGKRDDHRKNIANFPDDLQVQQWPGEQAEPGPVLVTSNTKSAPVEGENHTHVPIPEMVKVLEWLKATAACEDAGEILQNYSIIAHRAIVGICALTASLTKDTN